MVVLLKNRNVEDKNTPQKKNLFTVLTLNAWAGLALKNVVLTVLLGTLKIPARDRSRFQFL